MLIPSAKVIVAIVRHFGLNVASPSASNMPFWLEMKNGIIEAIGVLHEMALYVAKNCFVGFHQSVTF